MEEERRENYCSKIAKELKWNLFGNSALGDNFLKAFKNPDKVYAALLLHSFESTGKVISQYQKYHLKLITIWWAFCLFCLWIGGFTFESHSVVLTMGVMALIEIINYGGLSS